MRVLLASVLHMHPISDYIPYSMALLVKRRLRLRFLGSWPSEINRYFMPSITFSYTSRYIYPFSNARVWWLSQNPQFFCWGTVMFAPEYPQCASPLVWRVIFPPLVLLLWLRNRRSSTAADHYARAYFRAALSLNRDPRTSASVVVAYPRHALHAASHLIL